ncbi:hypothetical protein O3P69_010177 [Scylla paramamosain]|uniref:Uncharacterized protein n=1 Tax=Scylla paramamosain TaxID=85552 RepID=A0AAW0TRJ2_SCYPA
MSQPGMHGWPRLAPALTNGGHLRLQAPLYLEGKQKDRWTDESRIMGQQRGHAGGQVGRQGGRKDGVEGSHLIIVPRSWGKLIPSNPAPTSSTRPSPLVLFPHLAPLTWPFPPGSPHLVEWLGYLEILLEVGILHSDPDGTLTLSGATQVYRDLVRRTVGLSTFARGCVAARPAHRRSLQCRGQRECRGNRSAGPRKCASIETILTPGGPVKCASITHPCRVCQARAAWLIAAGVSPRVRQRVCRRNHAHPCCRGGDVRSVYQGG